MGYIIANLLVRKENEQGKVGDHHSQHLGDTSRRIRSSRPGSRETAQSVTCLLSQHEDLSIDPQHLCVWQHTAVILVPEQRTMVEMVGSWGRDRWVSP